MWARFLHRIVPLEWFGVGTPSTPTPNCIITRCLDRGGACTWASAPLAWPLRGDISINFKLIILIIMTNYLIQRY